MSYKYKVNAVSYVGDTHRTASEFFFADNLTSVNQGVCNAANIRTDCKGKKHIFSVSSCADSVNQMCGYLADALMRQNSAKVRIKVQYELKNVMEEVGDVICRGDDEADMSMIYIDSGNVYVAGFGDINVYHFSKKTSTAKKISFPLSSFSTVDSESESDSDVATKLRQPPRARCIGSAQSGDEYLAVGAKLAELLGDELICDILARHHSDASSVLIETAHNIDTSFNLTAVHVAVKKQRKVLWTTLAALLVAVLAVAALCVFDMPGEDDEISQSGAIPASQPAVDDEIISSGEKTEPPEEEINSLEALIPQLDAIAARVTGDQSIVAYYVKNLSTGESIESNDCQMYSASLIKLYIMAEIYRQADVGEISIDASIKDKLTRMITVSDNDACNELAAVAGGGNIELGFQKITSNALVLGCTYTQQKNDLQAVRPVPIPTGNFTSVKDCGIILEKIYKGELVNSDASAEMLNLLKAQQRRSKIPKYLPSSATVANKTGETSTAQNDVAIVYTDKADYIICIMINDYANSMDDTMEIIARMSETAYNYIVQ